MKIKFFAAILAAFLIFSPLSFAQDAPPREKAKYVSTVDGDTIKVEYRGNIHLVRLIGIDAPESKANAKAKKDAQREGKSVKDIVEEGKDSKRYLEDTLKDRLYIDLEFDESKYDSYNRLLAYVWLDEKTMLNEQILKNGYAQPITFYPNTRYSHIFGQAKNLPKQPKPKKSKPLKPVKIKKPAKKSSQKQKGNDVKLLFPQPM
jgi:micrococcal nuclease